jgi:hypothetical protein
MHPRLRRPNGKPTADSDERRPSRRAAAAAPLSLAIVWATAAPAAGSGAAPPGAAWRGEEVVEEGITHVRNPAAPIEAPVTLEPEELWRLGGETEADEEIFGRVERVLLDSEGNAYFLDTQLSEVRVFSASGEYLRTLGRAGEGPGEFRNPVDFFFLPGGRLAVAQVMPTRIAVLGPDGAGLDDFPLPFDDERSMLLLQEARSRGDEIFLSYINPVIAGGGVVLKRGLIAVDPDGKRTATLKEDSQPQSGGAVRITDDASEDFYRNWEIGSDGRVYVAPHYQRYQILALDPRGNPPKVIERAYESVKRTDEELAQLREEQEAEAGRWRGADVRREPSPFRRDIGRIAARESGELWVLPSRGRMDLPAGTLGTFDVYDSSGRFVRQVTVKADFDDRYDDFAIAGDRLFVFKEANSASDQVSTGAGGRMVMVRRGGGRQGDEREPRPFEIISYRLPN